MTHMGNYANDRLALYTFESVIKFVKCWTNLELKQVSPLEMGIKYFEMYPEDKEPIWQVSVRREITPGYPYFQDLISLSDAL